MAIKESGEGHTGDGRHVRFMVDREAGGREAGIEALKLLEELRFPEQHEVNMEHGGYGRYSRYEVAQHEYAGGDNEVGGGYYEILEVADPPADRHPIVSYGYMYTGQRAESFFVEWESVEAARRDMGTEASTKLHTKKHFQDALPEGAIRLVECGYLQPWFYAVGNQKLVGDYTLPDHLAEDPVYRFGREFVVPEDQTFLKRDGQTNTMKVCMGVARLETKRPEYPYGTSESEADVTRIVQWHDGSTTVINDTAQVEAIPRAAQPGELWVADAQREFDRMLNADVSRFEIKFADGGKFIGRYVEAPTGPKETPAGMYSVEVTFSDGRKPAGGWIDFEPSEEHPSLGSYIHEELSRQGKPVEKVVVRAPGRDNAPGKRLGAFYRRGT